MSDYRQRRNETDSQRKDRQQREIELKEQKKLMIDDCHKLLGIPEFKRVMHHMLAMGRIMQSPMTGNSQTFYNIGKQDLAKEQWTLLAEADADAAFDLLKPKKNNGES